MADKVKIGVIGTGMIGKKHIERYGPIAEAELVAVCDVDEAEARKVAGAHGVPNVCTDYKELLAMDEIEAVDVCVHNQLHCPLTVDALNAGKHVYCEKPMAGTVADAQKMYDTAQATGKKLGIQLGRLFKPESHAARRLIDEGMLGNLYYAKACGHRRRGRPFVDGYGTPPFVNKQSSGGGALLDMAVYHIALALWLLDNPPLHTVSASTYQEIDMYEDRREESGFNVEELGVGIARLGDDVTLFIEESWALHMDQGPGIRVMGSKGGVKLEPFAFFSTVADMEMDATFHLGPFETRRHRTCPEAVAYDSPQHHWVWGLLGRVPMIDTAGIALKTAQITEGMYMSGELKREVTFDEIKGSCA